MSLCSFALRRRDDGVSHGLQAYDHYKATGARILCSPRRWKEFLLKLAEALTLTGQYKKAMEVQEQAASVLMRQVDKSSRVRCCCLFVCVCLFVCFVPVFVPLSLPPSLPPPSLSFHE